MLCIWSSRGKISRDQTNGRQTANLEMIWNFLTSAFLELDNCSVDQQSPSGLMRRRPLRLFLVVQLSLHSLFFRLDTSQQTAWTSTFVHDHHDPGRSFFFFFEREGRGVHAEPTASSLSNNYFRQRRKKSSCEVPVGCICFGTAVPAHWTPSTCWGRMESELRLQEGTRIAGCRPVVRTRRRIRGSARCRITSIPTIPQFRQSRPKKKKKRKKSQHGARRASSLAFNFYWQHSLI